MHGDGRCTLDAELAARSGVHTVGARMRTGCRCARHVLSHAVTCAACMRRYEFRLHGNLENGSDFDYKIADANGEAADTFFAFFVPAPAFADIQAGTTSTDACGWGMTAWTNRHTD